MQHVIFQGSIRLRTEPDLRDAIHEIARQEKMTSAEFLRRELRKIVKRRGAGSKASAGAEAVQ